MPERGELLKGLSKKLIHLSGNDMIHKRLSGKGTAGIFNVCDEIPQFVLNRLMEGKKFKIIPMMEPNDYLADEKNKKFENAFSQYLDNESISEDSLEEDEIREKKDLLRIELGMQPSHELIPSGHTMDLPRTSLNEAESERHTDNKLQTDLSDEKLKKCLVKIDRERVRFEREKGLRTLFAAFGFLQWQNGEGKNFTSPILLLDVSLEKGRGKNSYKILGSGDLQSNESLNYALLQETGMQPPQAHNFVDQNGYIDLIKLYEAYEKFIEKYNSWKVLNRISVGIFKSRGIPFTEILPEGYSDKQIDAAEELLIGRDKIATNAGQRDVDNTTSRDLVPAFALNADSSQHAAILEVAEGKNLVIEGPPGTGKSQTIVNLISNALYQKKKVLFLAQKTAALEVVSNRLVQVGLGKKCLSLHSEYTRKSTLFVSIGEKIVEPLSEEIVTREQFNRLRQERDLLLTQLNDHAHNMGKNVFEGGDSQSLSEDQLIAHHALTTFAIYKDEIKGEQIPDFRIEAGYDLRDLNKDLEQVSQIQELVLGIDEPSIQLLPILGYSKVPSPFEIDEIFDELNQHLDAINMFPENYTGIDIPSLENFTSSLNETFKQKVLFENAEKSLSLLVGNRNRPTYSETKSHLDQLAQNSSFGLSFKSKLLPWTTAAKAKKFFELKLNLRKSDYNSLKSKANELCSNLQKIESVKSKLTKSGHSETSSQEIKQQLTWLNARVADLKNASQFTEKISLRIQKSSAEEFLKEFCKLKAGKNNFKQLCEINSLLSIIDERLGCASWIKQLIVDGKPLRKLTESGLYKFFSKTVSQNSPNIFNVDGKNMNRLRSQFKKAEEDCRSAYVRCIATGFPSENELPPTQRATRVGDYTGQQLLNHIQKTPTARITVRELTHRAIDTLKHYTPCFLMTPSSVADYIPKSTEFDLVIIDEASQMLPEEAIGSILRSKQIVVVGDPKQMPPTRYMQSTLDDEIDPDDDTNYSILDRAMLSFQNFRRLCYHYRSEDEALIRFSNNEFYENDLMTVPNLKNDDSLGIHFVDAKGVYNSGNVDLVTVDEHGQTTGWSPSKNPNPKEAQKLVELILHEIRERPNWSIGVAVMNLKQAIRVEELFNDVIDDKIRSYLSHWRNTPEYFFIKNLENVQGDERDTIIISTVYGRDQDDRMFQRYGPINMDKGENRINVLVTRAKKRVVVCSSLKPNDIKAQNRGPQVLRRYIQYAKTGHLEDNATTNQPDGDHWYDAPWEKWFHDRLEADGYEVQPQVGVSGWRIDLGVKHKDYPDGYLCGVELDGKDHLKQSARDRDIERQAILESKGWTILRVWSIDFFNDMEGEYQLLKSEIDQILDEKRKSQPEVTSDEVENFVEEDEGIKKESVLEY